MYRELPLVVNGAANVASTCKYVYTSTTRAWWGVPIHIYLSVPGVREQYTGFHNWTSPCFMYVHGSSLLIFIKRHLLRFLSGKYSVWNLIKDFDFQKICNFKQTPLGLFLKSIPLLRNEAKTGYQYNYISLPANKYVDWVNECEWVEQHLLRSKRKRLRRKTPVHIVYYSCTYILGRREKKTKIALV